MDWVDPISSEPVEEKEDDMSSLTTKFVALMLKRAAIAQRKITSVSKGPGGKCPKLPGPNEEAQKSSVVSSDYYGLSRISLNALPALEGAAQNTSKEACVSLEDGALARGPPNTDQAVSEAPTAETTICFLLQAR